MMEDRAGSLNIKTQDRRERPNAEQPQKCPRCDSLNTKFCYYNNYSPSQPRYFCKDCRRYWTKGGTLRNVPVGGGCRKGSKRPKRFGSDNIMMNNPSIHQDGQASIFPILSPFSGIRPHFFFNQSSAGPKNITDVKASAGTPSVSSLVMQPQFADGLTLGGYNNIFSSSSSTLPHPHHELHPTSLPHAEYLSPKIQRWETGDGCMTTTIFQPSGTGKQAVVSTRMPCPMKSEPQVGVEGSASASPIGVCYWNGTSSNSEQWPAGLSGYAPSNSYS